MTAGKKHPTAKKAPVVLLHGLGGSRHDWKAVAELLNQLDRSVGQDVLERVDPSEQIVKNIYPVHPKAEKLHGLKTYRSILEIAEPIDYVISAIPARQDGIASAAK